MQKLENVSSSIGATIETKRKNLNFFPNSLKKFEKNYFEKKRKQFGKDETKKYQNKKDELIVINCNRLNKESEKKNTNRIRLNGRQKVKLAKVDECSKQVERVQMPTLLLHKLWFV